jgi:hypothetical protein
MRPLLRSALLAIVISAGAIIMACGGAATETLDDNGANAGTSGDPGTTSGGATSGGTTSGGATSGGTTSGGTSGTPGTDAGTAPNDAGGGADAADAAPPPPVDVFTGAGPFVSKSAGNGHHNAGQNCMGGCHNHGFTFAGTLTDGAGNPVNNAEVRLVDANKQAILVNTGTNGNFYSSTPWVPPAKVGARTATNKVLMIAALTTASNGGCNGCHTTGGAAPKIHVP